MKPKQNRRSPNHEATGSDLAKRLMRYSEIENVIIVALPYGGVPLAAKVAGLLNMPFDVMFVGKITAPGCGGMALESITGGGVRVLNAALADRLQLKKPEIDTAILHGALKLARRERSCRGHHPSLQVAEHTVILIDDGSTPCAVLRDAIRLLRRQHADSIILAFPAACRQTLHDLSLEADKVVALAEIPPSASSGIWLPAPRHATDARIRELLASQCPSTGVRN